MLLARGTPVSTLHHRHLGLVIHSCDSQSYPVCDLGHTRTYVKLSVSQRVPGFDTTYISHCRIDRIMTIYSMHKPSQYECSVPCRTPRPACSKKLCLPPEPLIRKASQCREHNRTDGRTLFLSPDARPPSGLFRQKIHLYSKGMDHLQWMLCACGWWV